MTRYAGSSGGGSSGGHYGSSIYGGSSTGSAAHYGTYDSAPVVAPAPAVNAPAPAAAPAPAPDKNSGLFNRSANKFASSNLIAPNEVHLTVNVPENAKVFVNGNPTTTEGAKRHFVSKDLLPNDTYRFEVKAVVEVDGKEVVQNKTAIISAGNGEELTFDLAANEDPVETVLTLNVPEGASVVLAQNSTKSDGSSRVYRTKQLRQGESWDDYKIEVTYQGITKEKTIRLIGGDKLELSFNFDDVNVADANKVAAN